MTGSLSMMIELLVAILLMMTIGYCVMLNGRLKKLRADDQKLKATIGELLTATEIAERAIAGLKLTVRDCDATLGDRLRTAERLAAGLTMQVKAGQVVLDRLAQITLLTKGTKLSEPAVTAESFAQPAPAREAETSGVSKIAARVARLRTQGVAA